MRSERAGRLGRFAIVVAAVVCALAANLAGCELGPYCANGVCQTDVICDDGGCSQLDGGVTHGG